MAVTKLDRCTWPAGMSAKDFKCHGPVATKNTEFSGTKMFDGGCMQQEEVDSNKYYHCCMVTDSAGKWYVYVEYGRVGATRPQFQVYVCASEAEAQKAYETQCAEKNTKRGEFKKVGGLDLFRPKVGKDVYVVQQLASRSFGLPDAKNITAAGVTKVATVDPKATTPKKATYRCDEKTTKLWRDLLGGAVTYARTTIQGGTIPTEAALDAGIQMLEAAKRRLVVVGDDEAKQVADSDLKQITYALYSSIPKIKPLGVAESAWILSKNNVMGWEQDIAAFRTALQAGTVEEIAHDDPLAHVPVDMEWINPTSDLGKWLMKWWPAATKNRHGYGPMKIKNLWKLRRHGDEARLKDALESTLKEMPKTWNNERPLHQEKERFDLSPELRKLYWEANCGLTFHGTRSVNVPGIVSTDLRFPAELVGVVITGAMFGPGSYFADDWMKSAGYTSLRGSYWSGGGGSVKDRHAFMFAVDTIFGNPHVASGPHGYTKPPQGHHCVFGKAGKSQVQNNEWIVYRKGRHNLRYLAEFDTN